MDPKNLVKPLIMVSATAAVMFVPTSQTTVGHALQPAILCATGTCCQQNKSICNAGGEDHENYYYQESGGCPR